MNRRAIGWALIGLGAVSLLAGVIGLASGKSTSDVGAADTTVPITSSATTTTTVSTTSTSATSTTSMMATTTTTVPVETAEEFVAAFAAAVDADDADFLFSRLHPVVVEIHGEELCRAWIAEEIVALSDYRLTAEPSAPARQLIQTPAGEREVDVISAPVSFTFQGESFETTATLSLVDGVMHWLGECR
ncbi:MAG: hypothetical protein ACRDU9_08185 [Acidimicrobiia bacterium]